MFRFTILFSALLYTSHAFMIATKTCAQQSQVKPDPNFNVNVLLNVNWFVQKFFPIGVEGTATCEKVNFVLDGNNLTITQTFISGGKKSILNSVAVPNGPNGSYRLEVNPYDTTQTTAPFIVLHAAEDLYIGWACMTPLAKNNGQDSDQALYVATPNGTPLTEEQIAFVSELVQSNGLVGNLYSMVSNPQANSSHCRGINDS